MNERMKKYLEKFTPAEIDQQLIDDLFKDMAEVARINGENERKKHKWSCICRCRI